jgi:hypothetical protein
MSIFSRRRRDENGVLEKPRISAVSSLLSFSQGGRGGASRLRTANRSVHYPDAPQRPLSSLQHAKYGRELAASIRAQTAPVLITEAEVCAALDTKRVPDEMECCTIVHGFEGKRHGPALYRAADVSQLLLRPRAVQVDEAAE